MSTRRPRPSRRQRLHRWAWALGIVATIVVVVSVISVSTPWPSALLIRSVFSKGGAETVAEMNRHVPDTPVDARLDVQYGDGSAGGNTTLDAFSPRDRSGALPTVVWIHGGAWISGSKADVAPYLRILAGHGYTAIGLNYTIAPEAAYPVAIRQLNDALGYIRDHAAALRVDPDRIVIAGDSAGGQLASQLDVLITNPQYAQLLGIRPAIEPRQLVGTVLQCGVYDLDRMADLDGIAAWGFKTALWAYTGTKSWSSSYEGSTMSTIDFVTPRFPPTYISGGNGDGLTWIESIPMSQTLQRAGVDVTTRFFPADHEPALPHEYQFHLDDPDARTTLQQTLQFLGRVTG
jgi:acetyl esterase/lipase